MLVVGDKPCGHRASKALAVHNDHGIPSLLSLQDVIKASLSVNHDSLLVWRTSRQAIAAILYHKDIAIEAVF